MAAIFPRPGSVLVESYKEGKFKVDIWTRKDKFCMAISALRLYGHSFNTIEEAKKQATEAIKNYRG